MFKSIYINLHSLYMSLYYMGIAIIIKIIHENYVLLCTPKLIKL